MKIMRLAQDILYGLAGHIEDVCRVTKIQLDDNGRPLVEPVFRIQPRPAYDERRRQEERRNKIEDTYNGQGPHMVKISGEDPDGRELLEDNDLEPISIRYDRNARIIGSQERGSTIDITDTTQLNAEQF